MSSIKIVATQYNKTEVTLTDCVSFRLEKERYTPYSIVSGMYAINGDIGEVMHLTVYIDDVNVHYGPIDKFEVKEDSTGRYVTFRSSGFSMGLAQNNITPGMRYSPTLENLMMSGTATPFVTWENRTETIRYIFVKEGSSRWDAIVAYGRKLNNSYPYIVFPNKVRVTWDDPAAITINEAEIIKKGSGSNYSSMVSGYYMKDIEDEYTLTYGSPVAGMRSIIREKYINLDRQWLDDPEGGLKHKTDYTSRGYRYYFLSYAGYKGEDLRSNITTAAKIIGEDFGTKEVSRLVVEYSKKGFVTNLWFYEDEYAGI